MRTTRKRKLGLSDIGRCHPKGRTVKQCLPATVYSKVAAQLHVKKGKVWEAVGCAPGEEHCLLDKASLGEEEKKQLRKDYLRPKRPKSWDADPDMWLDNYNILHVMKQYEEAFPWFRFKGVFPIDFSAPDPYIKTGEQKCLYNELCHIDLKAEYAAGVRGIGVVFNLDPHFKGGSHWVALYVNLKKIAKPIVSYFDSYGYKTPPMVARLMRTFKLQIPSCELGFNARRFQYGNSECGMFSMYFIICMLRGITFKEFCKDSVKDGFMLELRKILFSK